MKKNILITGSTDGIGKLTAVKLAQDGHTVYLHGRNQEKLLKTINEIKASSGNEEVYGFVADFSDLESVKQLAQQIKNRLTQLDVLINNAGIFKSSATYASNGYELRYMVNYLAPYVLTNELLPLIDSSSDGRIINLSSAAQSEISLEVIKGKQYAGTNETYAQSKLALTMWSFYLALQCKGVTVVAVNPGSLLNTKMVKEAYGQHWSPADKGANILCELALDDKHKKHSGEYFDNDAGHYANAHPEAYNADVVEELIQFTNNLV